VIFDDPLADREAEADTFAFLGGKKKG